MHPPLLDLGGRYYPAFTTVNLSDPEGPDSRLLTEHFPQFVQFRIQAMS